MKILVTGCAGMIGCYLTAELLRIYPKKEGNEIIVIDNLSRGKLTNLKESCGENYEDLNFIKSDLTVYSLNWAEKFNKCD